MSQTTLKKPNPDQIKLHRLYGLNLAQVQDQNKWFVQLHNGAYYECLPPISRWVALMK